MHFKSWKGFKRQYLWMCLQRGREWKNIFMLSFWDKEENQKASIKNLLEDTQESPETKIYLGHWDPTSNIIRLHQGRWNREELCQVDHEFRYPGNAQQRVHKIDIHITLKIIVKQTKILTPTKLQVKLIWLWRTKGLL